MIERFIYTNCCVYIH